MERSRGVTVYGRLIVVFGIYTLLGTGAYGQFSLMFRGLAPVFIIALYAFTILYGISGVYCGLKILRLEDWARKLVLILTLISAVSGLFLNRIAMSNFKDYISSGRVTISPDIIDPMYKYAVVLTAIVTIFELSIIFFFTRPNVARQFKVKA